MLRAIYITPEMGTGKGNSACRERAVGNDEKNETQPTLEAMETFRDRESQSWDSPMFPGWPRLGFAARSFSCELEPVAFKP